MAAAVGYLPEPAREPQGFSASSAVADLWLGPCLLPTCQAQLQLLRAAPIPSAEARLHALPAGLQLDYGRQTGYPVPADELS